MKVSVVVPTYRSGDGLDRLIASIDAQTLPASEFEVVFVDDGSPDDTYDRLRKIQATRPHVRLERIENSGWPCRPRNVGTDLAVGEFVAYLDHDDLLYPDALRAAYEYAVATGADVVNGKEARTNDAEWAIDSYREDQPQALGRLDRNPLIPMNPHKLYRRAFLDEHGIRFREGGRVLWEDIFFNLLVARHAKVIATLASVPYYHWYTTPGSGSHGFLRSTPDFWRWLREVIVATRDDLPGDGFELPRGQLIAHQYRTRLLGSFDGRFAKRPEAERDLIYRACRDIQTEFSLTSFDAQLNRSGAIRAHLLHADERGLLERVAQHDPGIPGWAKATGARWVEGRLEVVALAEWSSPAGRRHALRADGERLLKQLPNEYRDVLPAELMDVTAEVGGAVAELGTRSRESRVTWMLPSAHLLRTSTGADGSVAFEVAVEATLDPETAVFGRPLEPGVWDLNARCTMAGSSQQQRLRADIAPIATMIGDEVRLAWTTTDGFLAVSVGTDEGRTVRRMRPDPAGLRLRADGQTVHVTVPLPDVEVVRPGTAVSVVEIAPPTGPLGRLIDRVRRRSGFQSVPATIAAEGERAVLRFALADGRRTVRLRIGDERRGAPRWWTLDARDGKPPRLTPER